MIGFFGSLEIDTGMGEEEVSYAGFQFANNRDFVFFVLEEGDGLHFVCQRWRSGIWGAGLAFGIAS